MCLPRRWRTPCRMLVPSTSSQPLTPRAHRPPSQVHTFDYVTMAIVKVVKTITRKKAHRITVQCHSMGTATVTTTWKQMAKQMCLKLQKFGLTSSIAPD